MIRPVTTGSCPLTMRADHHELRTPRTTLRARYVRVLGWCKSCRRRRDADLQALVDAGRGDVPLIHSTTSLRQSEKLANHHQGARDLRLGGP